MLVATPTDGRGGGAGEIKTDCSRCWSGVVRAVTATDGSGDGAARAQSPPVSWTRRADREARRPGTTDSAVRRAERRVGCEAEVELAAQDGR